MVSIESAMRRQQNKPTVFLSFFNTLVPPTFSLKKITLIIICLGVFFISPTRAHQKPNIIIVLADDLGYGDLGCYGQKLIQTPNLDRMATEGCRFTNFYSGSTVCAPSRYALMTGKDMGHAYIRGNKETPLRGSDLTIPKLAKQRGYVTGMFGKWGLGLENNSGSPEQQGWDEFLGYLSHRSAHNFYVKNLWETRGGVTVPHVMDTTQNTAPYIFDAALSFIKVNRANPFFLYIPITLPHAEMTIPTKEAITPFLNASGNSIFIETPFVKGTGMSKTYSSQSMPNAATASMIRQIDLDMGRLMSLLKELGLDKNTYVFFTSDNGPHQEGGRNVKQFESTAGLRGFKRDLYEGGIRVPAIAWGMNGIQKKVSREPLANWDFLPTIAEIIGAKVPGDITGVSFLDVLQKTKHSTKHEILYWEFHERGFDQALRKDNWKAIKRSANNSKLELYNLANDYSESNDVALQNPLVVKEIEALFSKARIESSDYPVIK
jgi:arylsulfatase A-like enzyme